MMVEDLVIRGKGRVSRETIMNEVLGAVAPSYKN
jgi:hypothetical protein